MTASVGDGTGAGGGFELTGGLLTGGELTGGELTGGGLTGGELTGGGTVVVPGGFVAGGVGVVGPGDVSAIGVVGVVFGGGGGFPPPPPSDVVWAGVLFGIERPPWGRKAKGGSKTPNESKTQVAQAGSTLSIPGGNDNCGVQILVRIECWIGSDLQFVVQRHLLGFFFSDQCVGKGDEYLRAVKIGVINWRKNPQGWAISSKRSSNRGRA